MTGIWNSRLICLNLLDRMMSEQWWRSVIFLIVLMFCVGTGAFVGINIGMDVTDLPSASDVVAILKANQITHVRLYDADNRMLNALAGTGIEVMVGVANEEVLGIGQSPSVAAAWINKNVVSYLPSTNITAIAVGSEVLTSIPNAAPILVPAMNYLHNALVASNINFQGQANCSAIQEGQPCYDPNTLQDHASYAYNDYFHKMQSIGGTCDFSGTATTTAVDPSHGSCVFAGSSGSNTTGAITPSTALGPTTSLTGVSSMLQVSEVVFLIPAILLALFGI